MNISIIGAGAWGTTVANLIAEKGNLVNIWDYSEEVVESIKNKHTNSRYLPDIELSKNLIPAHDLKGAVSNKELLIMAVPSKYLDDVLENMNMYISSNTHILSLVKGMILTEPQELITDHMINVIKKVPKENYFTLSGPNFAIEVARKLPAATVIGGIDQKYLKTLQEFMSTDLFRVYITTDYIGVQLGGILKNVIAIAGGICEGLYLGSNTKSSLIVRGISEMKKIFTLFGGKIDTLYGLSGLGDLIGSCSSDLSRNRWAGIQIAKGATIQSISKESGKTIEGIDSIPAIKSIGEKNNLELPICNEVYEIVYNGKDYKSSIRDLMRRTLKVE